MKRRIIKVSPFTGGKVEIIEQDTTLKFRGGTYTVKRKCYRCVDTGREFTDDAQDTDLMWALFRAYWERKGFNRFCEIDGYKNKEK